ncbi:hypothetical protein [Endozoicomonas sp. ALC066]|uniref:hypothetical protein n=1 Tax=Endozoicomonas sp. ALC066 TaxID=3403078 RepID=UPI003BB75237
MTMYLHRIEDTDSGEAPYYAFSFKGRIQGVLENHVDYKCQVIHCARAHRYIPVPDAEKVITTPFHNHWDLEQFISPENYSGFEPVGHFYVYSRTRDSGIIENSNYEMILEELTKKWGDVVYDYRASHWGCGWVETILMKPDAPEKAQKHLYEILGALSDSPVYCEQDYSERVEDEACDLWYSTSDSEKEDYCSGVGVDLKNVGMDWCEIPDELQEEFREVVRR